MSAKPQEEEARLTQAELLLAAKDFTAARDALGDLADTHPTQRSLAILAAAERGSGAPEAEVRRILCAGVASVARAAMVLRQMRDGA